MRLSEQIAYDLREKYVSREMPVLTERADFSLLGQTPGHTENFLRVLIDGERLEANELVDVELIENTPRGLVGKVLNRKNHKRGGGS